MIPILTLIFVVALSMFVTKTATIALMHTGMSRDRARFQARSAFSGAGFTTSESETVVKHPVRRKIIMILILLGNAGVVTAVSSLILGFVGRENSFGALQNLYLLLAGGMLLYLAARSNRLDRFLEKIINRWLENFTDIRPRNFARMMTIMEDYEVTEVDVEENEWLKGRCLKDLKLPQEGLLVLGIVRNDNQYIGVPRGRYEIEAEDRLIVYGRRDHVNALCERKDSLAGKASHKQAVESHEEELAEQDSKVARSKNES